MAPAHSRSAQAATLAAIALLNGANGQTAPAAPAAPVLPALPSLPPLATPAPWTPPAVPAPWTPPAVPAPWTPAAAPAAPGAKKEEPKEEKAEPKKEQEKGDEDEAAASKAKPEEGPEAAEFRQFIESEEIVVPEKEFPERLKNYLAAKEAMEKQNSHPKALWKAKLTRFSVLSAKEMEANFGLLKGKFASGGTGSVPRDIPPERVDWRDHADKITPIKNQGACGSCWSFAATAVMETAIAAATGHLMDLSPQQLVSCMPNPDECGGAGGCQGATAQLAFNYTIKKGITTIWKWPYTSGIERTDGECFETYGWKRPIAGITGYVQVKQNDAVELMKAVVANPVSVSVAASSWGAYSEGVFDGCDTARPIVNHAVVLMGYGWSDDGHPYWVIRNSWGVGWGEKGYIRLLRSADPNAEPCGVDDDPLMGYSCKNNPPETIKACGMCGILADSAYPIGGYLGEPQGPPDDPAIDSASKLFNSEVPRVEAPKSHMGLTAAAGIAGVAVSGAAVLVALRRNKLAVSESEDRELLVPSA